MTPSKLSPPPARPPSRVWYLVAGGLLMIGVAIAATGISQSISTVEAMYRVVMPGRAEIVLPAGGTTLYAESRSVVDGKAYAVDGEPDFHCGIADPAGKALPLERASSKVTYSFGGYQGRNVFDVDVAVAGTYVLSCEGPRPFTLAIGRGVGTWIVVAVVGGLVPAGLAVLVFLIVLIKRVRHQRGGRAQAAAP
jgi:hypothetical protein